MITADNISYNVGPAQILHNVSMTLESGKFTAVLGPNGAGKSSLLKCLTGAIRPSSGSISLDEKNIADYSLEALAKKRAVLSQQNVINFPFTAIEIVLMGRHPFSTNHESSDDAAIAEKALEKLDALHLKDRIYPTLSGGEQQRVQFARVLVQLWGDGEKNKYLFLDEPTSSLDLKHQYITLKIAKELTEKNITVCCILHDLHLAAQFADRVILMKNGAVVSAGNTADICKPDILSDVFDVTISDISLQRFFVAA